MVTTITLRVTSPTDRVLHIPIPPEVPQGPLEVVVVIAPAPCAPLTTDLEGRWQAYFPPDFDLERALNDSL